MIRPLRQLHRRTFFALGIFLPVAFAVGIAARKPVTTVGELPPALAPARQFSAAGEWKRDDLFVKTGVSVQLWREQKNSGQFALAVSAAKNFVKPDLLVYWQMGRANVADTLPTNAILLGAFSLKALPLSDEISKSSGTLILYSLADGEIVDVSKPFSLPTLNPSRQ